MFAGASFDIVKMKRFKMEPRDLLLLRREAIFARLLQQHRNISLRGQRKKNVYLNGEERSDDMNGGFFVGGRQSSLLFRKLDNTSGNALKLSNILTSFANDTADLSTRHQDFDRQPYVFGSGDEALFAHLFENQVLSLHKRKINQLNPFELINEKDFMIKKMTCRRSTGGLNYRFAG